jgi:HlyD family secretion protein
LSVWREEMMTRTRLFVLTLLAALIFAGCSSALPSPPTPEPFTPPPSPTPAADSATAAPIATAVTAPTAVATTSYTVQRGDVLEALMLEGNVISSQQQDLIFGQPGQIKSIIVAADALIKKGDLLAELDDSDLQEQLVDVQTSYDRAKSAYDRSLSAANVPLRKAEIDLIAARDALTLARRPATPEQIAAAQATVQSADAALAQTRNDASAVKNKADIVFRDAELAWKKTQAELQTATAAYDANRNDGEAQERYDKAVADAQAAQNVYDQAKIDFDTARNNEIALIQAAQAQVAAAQVTLDTLLKLPDPFAVKKAERDVALAQVAVDDARTRVVGDPELESRLDDAKQELDDLNEQIAARQMFAPFDGQVVSIIAQVGAQVQVDDPILSVINPAIAADAREVQLTQIESSANIRVGQVVAIVLAGDQYSGRVTRVLGDPATGTRSAYVAFDQQPSTLNPGDLATIGIELSKRSNVLWLPPSAIRNDGRSFVLVQDGASVKRIDIEIGAIGIERIEILRGLTEGQTILGT